MTKSRLAFIMFVSVILSACSVELNDGWETRAQSEYANGNKPVLYIVYPHGENSKLDAYIFFCDEGQVVMENWIGKGWDKREHKITIPREKLTCNSD